jgi:hypothetical protein
MALCPVAWKLVIEGLIPSQYSTPPIVEECGKKQHDKLLGIVSEYFDPLRNIHVLVRDPSPKFEYSVKIGDGHRLMVLKPDLYLLMKLGHTIVNVSVEATTRSPAAIPAEWLTAYALGAYLTNMQPSITLLVTPTEVKALPLSISLLRRLEKLLNAPPSREPADWLCSNCDLRPVCPEPLA